MTKPEPYSTNLPLLGAPPHQARTIWVVPRCLGHKATRCPPCQSPVQPTGAAPSAPLHHWQVPNPRLASHCQLFVTAPLHLARTWLHENLGPRRGQLSLSGPPHVHSVPLYGSPLGPCAGSPQQCGSQRARPSLGPVGCAPSTLLPSACGKPGCAPPAASPSGWLCSLYTWE